MTRSVIASFCLLVCYLLLQRASDVPKIPILQPLAGFPKNLGDWRLKESYRSSARVLDILKVDDYIRYNYLNGQGKEVSLYLAYYEAVKGESGYHSPRNCLPGGEWGIVESKIVTFHPADDTTKTIKAMEMIIRNRNDYQVVVFWYRNRGRTIHSEYLEKFYLLIDTLVHRRRDGSLVRLMANAPQGDPAGAEKLLADFAGLVYPELDRFIPGR